MRTSNQRERLQKLKQGEGTFVYLGGAFDTEAVPGIPVLDKHGKQLRSVVFKTVEAEGGRKVQVVDPDSDDKGELVWKRAPRFLRKEMDPFRVRLTGVAAEHVEDGDGINVKLPSLAAKADVNGDVPQLFLEFKKGEEVFVGDPRIALKLRCLPFFREVEGDAAEGEAPKKRGRARKEQEGDAAEG